jgi:hypothetical protein
MVEVHTPYNPIVGLDTHLTHKLKGNLTFNALALNVPFSFYAHILQIPKLPKESEISPHGSGLWPFWLFYDTTPQSSVVSKSQTIKGSTLTRGGVLKEKERTGPEVHLPMDRENIC